MAGLWHAYVDESGDRGWKRRPPDTPIGVRLGSSEHFATTAVVVPDGAQTPILDRWSEMAVEIGREPGDTLHWVNVRSHSQRTHVAGALASLEQLHICSVVYSKWDVPASAGVGQPDYLYNWVLRLLVERLSWFAKERDGRLVMHFAEVKGLPPAVIADYLCRLQGKETQIKWPSLVMPARVNTPRNQRMLQVADAASGAVFAAFEWDEFGNVERRYLETIRPRIWAYRGGDLHSYGLKVNPWPHPRHGWLREFCRG